MLEEGKAGTYNAASHPISMNEFVDEIATQPVDKEWIEDDILSKEELGSRGYPFWVPISEDHPEGFVIVDNQQAVDNGLMFRPLRDTANDTREWVGNRELKAGPTDELEQKLLKKK